MAEPEIDLTRCAHAPAPDMGYVPIPLESLPLKRILNSLSDDRPAEPRYCIKRPSAMTYPAVPWPAQSAVTHHVLNKCVACVIAAPARIAAATVAISANISSLAPASRAAFTCNSMQ